jgi:hypothetical protein
MSYTVLYIEIDTDGALTENTREAVLGAREYYCPCATTTTTVLLLQQLVVLALDTSCYIWYRYSTVRHLFLH